MRSVRLTLCAGAVVAAVFPPVAHAADTGPAGLSVTPAGPASGSDIRLRATGCAGRTGTAVSAAFVADARLTGGAGGGLVGETRVRSTVRPGSYPVEVTCDGRTDRVRGTVTVADPAATPTATAPASPVAPVRAGGGATAHFGSVDAHEAGPGTRQAVTGLVLAGVAAVAVAVRSSRRGQDGRD
ncbi:hypothetical protein ACGFS9_07120 [Streptomyces sp. NPDC048566]|uniref:hypothetical protein n=1 Tax=Streptomyces sp. NPDC048566 TaxID=3365569 RepID=UPI00371595ED